MPGTSDIGVIVECWDAKNNLLKRWRRQLSTGTNQISLTCALKRTATLGDITVRVPGKLRKQSIYVESTSLPLRGGDTLTLNLTLDLEGD